MGLDHLNPFLRYASVHYNCSQKKENSICYDCRLFYVIKGEGKLFVNGQSYVISPNLAVYLPSGTKYSFNCTNSNDVAIYVLNFDLTDEYSDCHYSLGVATEKNFDSKKMIPVGITDEFSSPLIKEECVHLHNTILECAELFRKKTANYQHFASAYLKLALIDLLGEHKREKKDYKLVQSVQEYIVQNYNDPTLNNSTIAEQFHYHPYHISRLMKKYTKNTLHGYIIDYRLHIAKNYLTTSTLNVVEIAERTGFSSYTYFIKLFRERVGVSPLQYRKNNKTIGF